MIHHAANPETCSTVPLPPREPVEAITAPGLLATRAGRPLPPDYALAKHTGGSWRLQVTLTTDARHAGKRHVIPLRTREINVARRRRDKLLVAFAARGWLARPLRVLSGQAGINFDAGTIHKTE